MITYTSICNAYPLKKNASLLHHHWKSCDFECLVLFPKYYQWISRIKSLFNFSSFTKVGIWWPSCGVLMYRIKFWLTFLQAVQQVLSNLLISHIELRTEDSIDIKQYSFNRQVDKIIVPFSQELTEVKNRYIKVGPLFSWLLNLFKTCVNAKGLYLIVKLGPQKWTFWKMLQVHL